MIDYREFRMNKLNTPEFQHLKLLFFWPVYGIVFFLLERGLKLNYHPVHCPLDDKIPFCEYFLIPYYFWFVFLIGMFLYTLLVDTKCFCRYMIFIMITYTVTCMIYLIYPTCQELRPEIFVRDNVFTDVVKFLYVFDTNTNVCPSIHVIGSLAVLFASWHTPRFRRFGWQIFFWGSAVLICLSTVFLKQHSVIDLVAAIPLCLIGYPIAFGNKFVKSEVKLDERN